MTVSEQIKEFRKTYDLSQQGLADWVNQVLVVNGVRASYTKQTVSAWESGRHKHAPGSMIVDVLANSPRNDNDLPLLMRQANWIG